MPTWKNLKVFLLGALWTVMLTLGPVVWTIWQWVTDPNDGSISWRKLLGLAGACAGPALLAYYQKHKALLALPPDLEETK
jgi:MFS family permease